MRLQNLNDDIVFDELEDDPNPNKIYFISSISSIPHIIPPKLHLANVYSSKTITTLMATYFELNKIAYDKICLADMKENVAYRLDQKSEGRNIDVIMFETDDVAKNVMFAFKTEDKATHLYAGVCTELRSLIFNKFFTQSTGGVSKLYLDVSRNSCDPDELNTAVDAIEDIFIKNPNHTINLNVPSLGYEEFIYKLSDRLRARIYVSGIISEALRLLQKHQYFVNRNDAKIFVTSNPRFTSKQMKTGYDKDHIIFVCITDRSGKFGEEYFYEIGFSPLPSRFQQQLLATMVHPERIYAIHHKSDTDAPPIPHYLLKYCTDPEELLEEPTRELNEYEDIFGTPSQNMTPLEPSPQVTQSANHLEMSQIYVREWLLKKTNL